MDGCNLPSLLECTERRYACTIIVCSVRRPVVQDRSVLRVSRLLESGTTHCGRRWSSVAAVPRTELTFEQFRRCAVDSHVAVVLRHLCGSREKRTDIQCLRLELLCSRVTRSVECWKTSVCRRVDAGDRGVSVASSPSVYS